MNYVEGGRKKEGDKSSYFEAGAGRKRRLQHRGREEKETGIQGRKASNAYGARPTVGHNPTGGANTCFRLLRIFVSLQPVSVLE